MRTLLLHCLAAAPLVSAMAAPPALVTLPRSPSHLEELLTSKDPAKALSEGQFKALQASDPALAGWIVKYRAATTAADLIPLILSPVEENGSRVQSRVDQRQVAILKAAASPRAIEALEMIAHADPFPMNQQIAADLRPLIAKVLDELDARGQDGFVAGLDELCLASGKTAGDPVVAKNLAYRQDWMASLLSPAIADFPSTIKRPCAVSFGLVRYFATKRDASTHARPMGFPNPADTDLARMLAEADLDGIDALCHVGRWGGPMYGGWITNHPGYVRRLPSATPPSASPPALVFTWELPEICANFWMQRRNPPALLEGVEKNPDATPAELFVACLLAPDAPRRAALGRRAFAGGNKEFENLAPEFRDPVAIDLFATLPHEELVTLPEFVREVVARHRKEMAALPPPRDSR